MNKSNQNLADLVDALKSKMKDATETISTLEKRLSHAGDVIKYQSIFLAVFGVFPTVFTIYTITQVNDIKTELNQTIGDYVQQTQDKRTDESIGWIGLPPENRMLRYKGIQILQSTQPLLSDAQAYKLLKYASKSNDRTLIKRIQEFVELQPNNVTSEFYQDEIKNGNTLFEKKLIVNYLASHHRNFILEYIPTIIETEDHYERYGFFLDAINSAREVGNTDLVMALLQTERVVDSIFVNFKDAAQVLNARETMKMSMSAYPEATTTYFFTKKFDF